MTESINPFQSFQFSLARVAEQEHDLDLQLSALEARLARLKEVRVAGAPLVEWILGVGTDKEELLLLARTIERVAHLMPEYANLKLKKQMLTMARERPDELAFMFADFGIDAFLHPDDPLNDGRPHD